MCDGDCPDPTHDVMTSDDVDRVGTYNSTAWLTKDSNDTALLKRNAGIVTQASAPADLVFISQLPGSAPPIDGHSYSYDGTSGTRAF
jgi:hypothetical protein